MFKGISRKINVFRRLPAGVKALLIEALFTSAWVKLSLKFFPFKKVMSWLGTAHTEGTYDPHHSTLVLRKQVKQALQLCNRYAFWPTECYTLSLTGKLLLRRRKIGSTLYIGFRRDEKGQHRGHAWLRANDTYLSGFRESKNFEVKLVFS